MALPKLGESVTEGVIGAIFTARRRRGRIRRSAVRGVDRQGRLGDPQPVRRRDPGGSCAARRNVPVGTPVLRIGGKGIRSRTGCPPRRTPWLLPVVVPSPKPRRRRWADRKGRPTRRPVSGRRATARSTRSPCRSSASPSPRALSAAGSNRSVRTVAFDDPLFEVSTDKVDSEIPSPYDGTLLEILVHDGETVPVGTVLARIGDTSGGAGRRRRPQPAQPASTAASPVVPAAPRDAGRRQRGRPAAVPVGAQARCGTRPRCLGDTGYRSRRADPARGCGDGGRGAGRTPAAAPAAATAPAPAAAPAAPRAVKAAADDATKWCR